MLPHNLRLIEIATIWDWSLRIVPELPQTKSGNVFRILWIHIHMIFIKKVLIIFVLLLEDHIQCVSGCNFIFLWIDVSSILSEYILQTLFFSELFFDIIVSTYPHLIAVLHPSIKQVLKIFLSYIFWFFLGNLWAGPGPTLPHSTQALFILNLSRLSPSVAASVFPFYHSIVSCLWHLCFISKIQFLSPTNFTNVKATHKILRNEIFVKFCPQ